MDGFKLQILGQYHGLLRNFCERSQRVSPFTMVYSSGAPATGLMLPSGGGRGLCSVTRGAFSGRRAGPGSCASRGCVAWGGTGGGGWSCSARAGTASVTASAPPSAALRHRAIVRVRIAAPSLEILKQLPRLRRLGRVRVLHGKLFENRLRLVLAPEDPQAAPALELRLRYRIAGRVLERHALEELQRAGAVAADFADQASEEQRVVGRTVARIRGGERQQIGLCLSVAPVIELLDRLRPGVVRIELARDHRVRIEASQGLLIGLFQLDEDGQGRGALHRVDPVGAAQAPPDLHRLQRRPGIVPGRSGGSWMPRRGLRLGRERGELDLQLLDPPLLLRDEDGLRLDLAPQLSQLFRFGRRTRRRAGASGEQSGHGDQAEAQADSSLRGTRAASFDDLRGEADKSKNGITCRGFG